MQGWRAKKYNIPVGKTRRLVVTLRKFRTSKSRRSKKFRQLVVPINFGKIREAAIRFQKLKRQKIKRPLYYRQRLAQLAPLGLVLLGIVGAAFFGKQIFTPHAVAPVKTFSTTADYKPAVYSMPASAPVSIKIPSVGIDVSVVPVGKDAAGAIAMPSFSDWVAGWYKYSPTPGQIGPAVIVGHLDTYTSTSVFWTLDQIKPGALIYIARADGQTAVFKATALQDVSQSNFPTTSVYGNANYPALRIITCGGTYNSALGRYSDNLVVYATLVPPAKD